MTYAIILSPIYDLGSFYNNGFPEFTGFLEDVSGSGQFSATATSTLPGPSINFSSLLNPPDSPGTLLITDPSGPGYFFRSGIIADWPKGPISLSAGTYGHTLIFPLSLSVTTVINIPGYITTAIGFATGTAFFPYTIRISSAALSRGATPGTITLSFSGSFDYFSAFTLFFPRIENFSGTMQLTLTPSGNALIPSEYVIVTTSNLTISAQPSLSSPLALPVVIALLSPLFSTLFSGPLTSIVNTAIDTQISSTPMPTNNDGTPLFSPAATISIQRIAITMSGIMINFVLAELLRLPTGPGSGSDPDGSNTDPVIEDRLLVTINPQPEEEISHSYVIHVSGQLSQTPVANATVTITSFDFLGRSTVNSGQTDAQGVVTLNATLRSKFRPTSDPTNTGQLERISPVLTVSKQGFQTFNLELLPNP